MAVIKGFRATTVWKAFILNALATAFAICAGLIIKTRLNKYVDIHGNEIQEIDTTKSLFWTFVATFIASFIAFSGMHFLFGYGGGMLVTPAELNYMQTHSG